MPLDGPREAGAWSLEDDIASAAGLFPRGAFRLQNRVYTDSKGAPKWAIKLMPNTAWSEARDSAANS